VKYRTIVADPPWPYADAGRDGNSALIRTVKRDGSIASGVQTGYAAMEITDLCALKPETETDAHLYLP
jgi:hypothetical protein